MGPLCFNRRLACMVEVRTNQFDIRDKGLKRSRSLSACHFSLIIAIA
jgi:hypothetical protein